MRRRPFPASRPMRSCPRCSAAYPDAVEQCPLDGTVLAVAPLAGARWAHAVEPAGHLEADSTPSGRPARPDPASEMDEPPGRPWTAEAALARGELSLASVAQAAARAEAARAAAEAASPRGRWPWIAAGLLALAALGGSWWVRASEAPREARHRLPPVRAEGGVVAREATPVPLEPAAPPAVAPPSVPASEEPVPVEVAPVVAAPEAQPVAPPSPREAPARASPPAAPVRAAPAGRVRASEAGFEAVVGATAGEQWVAVRASGADRRLAKTFTAATTLGNFSFEWLDDRPVVVFSAADARWTTHYAWDYDAGVLFWTAYDSQTRQTTLGPTVAPGSEIEERLRRPR